MEKEKNQHPVLRVILLILLALMVAAALVFIYFGGFGTGASASPEAMAACAGGVNDIAIPDSVTMVALGEATHGNAQFQQLKLDVFSHLVEDYGVRALALEGDYGGCEQANRYIHGGEGTAQEAAAAIGFAIYRTEEMAELISYMRSYNDSAAPGDDLRFYGFDMQRFLYSFNFLVEACKALDVDTAELEALVIGEDWSEEFDNAQRETVISAVKDELEDKAASAQTLHMADMLLQYCQLQSVDAAEYGDLRDKLMAESALWIAQQEKDAGHPRIFITGHNGHIGRFGYDNMGKLLADELGEGYYAIGTDFYKTRCNIPTLSNGRRHDRTFYSYDPLAKAAKLAGLDVCWLDFTKAAADPELAGFVSDYNFMGSLGEGYAWYMRLLPYSYRIFQQPGALYDGMIFVTYASPITVVDP